MTTRNVDNSDEHGDGGLVFDANAPEDVDPYTGDSGEAPYVRPRIYDILGIPDPWEPGSGYHEPADGVDVDLTATHEPVDLSVPRYLEDWQIQPEPGPYTHTTEQREAVTARLYAVFNEYVGDKAALKLSSEMAELCDGVTAGELETIFENINPGGETWLGMNIRVEKGWPVTFTPVTANISTRWLDK